MGKCLVTKLNGTVDNDNLLRIGEIRLFNTKLSNPTANSQYMSLTFSKDANLEIVGDAYFTDTKLSENRGKTKSCLANQNGNFYVSNNDCQIAILDKYSLVKVETNAHRLGDLEDLRFSKGLISMIARDSGQTGDISNLKNLTALTTLSLGSKRTVLTGDIGELRTLTKCTEMYLSYNKFTGDLATLPSVCSYVSLENDKGSVLTWSTRPSSAKIIAFVGTATLTNIDKMLQDQAQCQVGFSESDPSWKKIIQIAGTRTSASDDAVATLQRKGYTISIA